MSIDSELRGHVCLNDRLMLSYTPKPVHPKTLLPATPLAPRKGTAHVYVAQSSDDYDYAELEDLYQQSKSRAPFTPPSKMTSSRAVGRGHDATPDVRHFAKVNDAKLSPPPAWPSSPAMGRSGDCSQEQPSSASNTPAKVNTKPLVLVNDDDDEDDDDDYVPTEPEDNSDTSEEEDGEEEEAKPAQKSNTLVSQPAPMVTRTSTSTGPSTDGGRFPTTNRDMYSPPLAGKRRSQDAFEDESMDGKRRKGIDGEVLEAGAAQQQQASTSGFGGFSGNSSGLAGASGSSGFGNSAPASSFQSFPRSQSFPVSQNFPACQNFPVSQSFLAPSSSSARSSSFQTFSAPPPAYNSAPFNASFSEPSQNWTFVNASVDSFAAPMPSSNLQANRSFHPTNHFANASLQSSTTPSPPSYTFASSGDAFGMRRSAPPQFGQASGFAQDHGLASSTNTVAPYAIATAASVNMSTSEDSMVPSFSVQPEQAIPEVPFDSTLAHSNAYDVLKAIDDVVASIHTPVASVSRPSYSAPRTYVRSQSLPTIVPRSPPSFISELIRRHPCAPFTSQPRVSYPVYAAGPSGLLSSTRGPDSRRLEAKARTPKPEASANAVTTWTPALNEMPHKIAQAEARLTRKDDARRAREETERVYRKEQERERQRAKKAQAQEVLREQRRREREEQEARQAEERRAAAFPVPLFMVIEERERKAARRTDNGEKRAVILKNRGTVGDRSTRRPSSETPQEDDCKDDGTAASGSTSSEGSVGNSDQSSDLSDCELAAGWGSRLRSMVSWALPSTST